MIKSAAGYCFLQQIFFIFLNFRDKELETIMIEICTNLRFLKGIDKN